MASNFGNPTANQVASASVFCPVGSWAALRAGTANIASRQWIMIQPQARATIRLALRFVNKNSDGTFTAPTSAAHPDFKIPSDGPLFQLPLGADVTLYGRAVQNGGTSGGIKVIVSEFS